MGWTLVLGLSCVVCGYWLRGLTFCNPETLLHFHCWVVRTWWRWQSRDRGGRLRISPEHIALTRSMSLENPLWGAPRIHGELLKLGYRLAVHRFTVHGAAQGQTVSGLGDVPGKPCRRDRGDRHAECLYDPVPASLCRRRARPWPAQDPACRSHGSSDGAMVGLADHRSIFLGQGAYLSSAGQ
jgi:hypothetical protein